MLVSAQYDVLVLGATGFTGQVPPPSSETHTIQDGRKIQNKQTQTHSTFCTHLHTHALTHIHTHWWWQLAAAYLSRQYPESSNVKWAIAGRSEAKLNEVLLFMIWCLC